MDESSSIDRYTVSNVYETRRNYSFRPRWIKDLGDPDIVAVKDEKYVIAEVKPSDQLRRYFKAKARLIFVTNVEEGERIEVLGDKELAE